MRANWKTLVALLGMLFALPLPAQQSARTLNLAVLDPKGQAVAGASVALRAGDKTVSTATTDGNGKAKLAANCTTGCTLKIEKKGYVPIEMTLDLTTPPEELEIAISPAALSEQSVEVKGEASTPVAETQPTATSLPPAQAKNTPSRPATLTDTLPLIPGIVRAPDGSVRIAGLDESHSALLVNSVDVTDPATGQFGLSVPIDSVQTVSVSEMPYLAQYGKFSAGVISAETRRGGDKWDYSLNDPLPDFRIRSAHLEGVTDATPRFNVSGPLIKNRLYLLEGAEFLFNNQEVRTLYYPYNLTRSTAFNSFTQLDAILSNKQTLTASYHYAPHNLRYANLDYFNPQPVTPNADFHESTAAITHHWQIADGLLQSTFAGTEVTSNVGPQTIGEMVLSPLQNSGSFFANSTRNATRFTWMEQWTPRTLHFHGDHVLQIGSTFGHSENQGQFRASPVLLQDASGTPLEKIAFVGGQPYDIADTEPALYAQDHWMMNSHLAVDMGVRLEGQTIASTTRVAPRGGVVWSPTHSGNTVFRGGIGVFYDSVPLDVYAFSSYPEQAITMYSGGVPVGPAVQYLNITGQAAESQFPFIDQRLRSGNFAPYSVAWNVEYEQRVNHWLLMRTKYLQSTEQDMITLTPQTVGGQPAFVLNSSGWAHTRQAEFTAKIGASAPRQFYFSYVRQYAYGVLNDASAYLGNFPSPIIQSNLLGSLPSEIPNRFLLWGTIGNLPKKVMLVPHLEFRSGFPYQPTNVYDRYLAITGTQPRYPNYFSFDLRVSKDIQVNAKHAIRLSLTGRNITNHFNALEVHSNDADPAFGTFFGTYPRRVYVDFDFLY